MLLDIFVPHWTEPWEVGRKGLDMLALQRCVDWNQVRVTIVHDGTEPFPEECFSWYPFKVLQVRLPENRGIAVVRNWIIEHAEGDWLRMTDFDDMPHDTYSIASILDALPTDKFDLLWFQIIGELENGQRYLIDRRDPVVLHDKIFRTKWLQESGIRFQEDLTWCEDSAFLALMEMEIDHQRIGQIKTQCPVFDWIERAGSLCNRPEVKWANRMSFFRRHCYVQNEFKKHGHMDQYYAMTVRVMGDAYYTLELLETDQDKAEHRAAVEAYYMAHTEDLLKLTRPHFDEVLAAVNRELMPEEKQISRGELLSWLKDIRIRNQGRGEKECLITTKQQEPSTCIRETPDHTTSMPPAKAARSGRKMTA